MKKGILYFGLFFAVLGTMPLMGQEIAFWVLGNTGTASESTVAGNGTKRGQNISFVNPNAFTGAVNTFVGDVQTSVSDFSYGRNGFPMQFTRYFHNGITSPFGEMGLNWASNYDTCLFVPIGTVDHVLLSMPHNSWKFQSPDNGNSFITPPTCFYKLQAIPGSLPVTYALTDPSGIVSKFTVLPGGEANIARLVEMDDLNGNKTILTYQSYNLYTETEYNCFNCSGYVVGGYPLLRLQTVTGNNWSINFSYYDDTSGAPTTTTLSASPVFYVVFQENLNGYRLRQITNSVGDVLTFDSGAQAGPITQVFRAHNNDAYSMNASYQYYSYLYYPPNSGPISVYTLKQAIDPLAPPGGRNMTYVCNNDPSSFTNPVRQAVNGNNQVMYSYDYSTDSAGNRLTNLTGPNGLIETDYYDSTSRLAEKRYTVDGHPFNKTFTFNQDDLVVNTVDGNGNAVTMAYNNLGNMTYRKDAEGYTESYTYSPVGVNSVGVNIVRLTQSIDKNQVTRNYDYDGNGNLLHSYEPGRTTTYQYIFSNGSLTQKNVTDANNHTITTNYDSNGNISSVQEPAIGSPENLNPGSTTYTIYDNGTTSNGQGRNLLTSVTDPLNQTTTYSYQNNAWLQTVLYSDQTTEQFTYDSNGNKTLVQDRNGTQAKMVYDSADHITDVYEAYGTADVRHSKFTYDALGDKTSFTDNKNQKTTFAYNEQNLVRSIVDSTGKGSANDYDGVLNPIQNKDTRGVIKTITYYKNNRVKSILFSDGTPSLSYTYDGNGNRTSLTDGVGPKNYTYDSLNEVLTVSDTTRNFNLAYTYDAVGNQLSMQNNMISGTTYYNYYEDNSVKKITDVDGIATTFVYDAMKNPHYKVFSNGVSAVYGYYPLTHRLQTLQNLNSYGEALSSFSYTYDDVGNRMSETNLSGTTNYVYDRLYQLRAAQYPGPQGTVGYSYDGVGNRSILTQNSTSQPFSYNSGNEMTNGLGESFAYDQAGNMIQRSSSAGATSYKWDGMNQLTRVTTNSGTINYSYDGDNHRIQKTTSNGTTNYFYDGNSVVVETDGNGNVLKSYTPGISAKDREGNKHFYLYNGHGDVAGMMDSNQNLTQSYSYDAFGKVLGDQKDTNNYRYVGLGDVFSDDDINLQYMWHRWYDPKLGRFVSRDPIGLSGGLNLYAYVSNNPLAETDPSGKEGVGPLLGHMGGHIAIDFVFPDSLNEGEDEILWSMMNAADNAREERIQDLIAYTNDEFRDFVYKYEQTTFFNRFNRRINAELEREFAMNTAELDAMFNPYYSAETQQQIYNTRTMNDAEAEELAKAAAIASIIKNISQSGGNGMGSGGSGSGGSYGPGYTGNGNNMGPNGPTN